MGPSQLQRFTFNLAAGARTTIYTHNRNLTLVTLTGDTTVSVSINDEPFVLWQQGLTYQLPGDGIINHLVVLNENAGGVTGTIYASQGIVSLVQDAPAVAVLSSILTVLQGNSTGLTLITQKTADMPPAAAVQLVAPSAAIRKVTICAHPNNTGLVYVGAAGVDSTNWYACLSAGGSVTFDSITTGLWAVGSADGQLVGGYQE